MRLRSHIFITLLLLLIFTGCDSGNILDADISVQGSGRVVKMTATISGANEWSSDQQIALAGFRSDSQYAVVQRSISNVIADNSEICMDLTVSSDVESVELAVTNKLRKRILTLKSIEMADYASTTDTIHFDLGEINIGRLGALQQGMFNQACIQCHGGNGHSAAGLQLTEGSSYEMLVDVPSQMVENILRVKSGDAESSLMRQILNEGGESLLHYNHTEIVSSQFKFSLNEVRRVIDDWINNIK